MRRMNTGKREDKKVPELYRLLAYPEAAPRELIVFANDAAYMDLSMEDSISCMLGFVKD